MVLKLLALPDSRFAVTEVLDLLGQEAVMARLELETKDIDSIRQWLVSSGIRWGANIDHKQNSWKSRQMIWPRWNEIRGSLA